MCTGFRDSATLELAKASLVRAVASMMFVSICTVVIPPSAIKDSLLYSTMTSICGQVGRYEALELVSGGCRPG